MIRILSCLDFDEQIIYNIATSLSECEVEKIQV